MEPGEYPEEASRKVSTLQAESLRHSLAAGRSQVNSIGAKAGFGKPVEAGCGACLRRETGRKRPAYTKPNPPEMCTVVDIFATWAMRATRTERIIPP